MKASPDSPDDDAILADLHGSESSRRLGLRAAMDRFAMRVGALVRTRFPDAFDPHDVVDAVDRTFEELWRRACDSRLANVTQLWPWLARSALRNAIDIYRRKRRWSTTAGTANEDRQDFSLEELGELARAGWVAIDIVQGGFTITQPGHSAVEKGEIPPFSFSRKAEETLLMECCSGALISQRDGISYTNEFALRQSGQWEKVQRLPVSFFDDRLDLGQVLPLLSHDAGEWIRWIDSPVLISRGRHWLLVRVNPQKQSVQWLPERWQRELVPMLLARAKGSSQPVPLAMAMERLETAAVGEEAVLGSEDLLLTRADHRECLRAALGEAKSTVLIASAFLNTVALESEIRQWILDALRRGVQVDLLWGYAASHSDQPAKVALRWLRELRKDARQMAGLLRFSSQPTESHAKLLICDPPSGHCAYVGSMNWLSMPLKDDTEDAPGSNITLRLRHPRLVANLCRTAAGLWMTSRAGQISDAPERLRRLAATLDQEQTMPPTAEPQGKPVATCRVSIVRDRDHEALLRDILLHNDKRVLLLSHKLGPIAGTRLASWQPANNDTTPRLITFFGESTIDPDVLDNMRAELGPSGDFSARRHFQLQFPFSRSLWSRCSCSGSWHFGRGRRSPEAPPRKILRTPVINEKHRCGCFRDRCPRTR